MVWEEDAADRPATAAARRAAKRKVREVMRATILARATSPPAASLDAIKRAPVVVHKDTVPSPADSLRRCLPAWREMDPALGDKVEHGVCPRLVAMPPSFSVPPFNMEAEPAAFIEQRLDELVRTSVIEEVARPPYCVSPVFAVEKTLPDGTSSWRLVVDLTWLNSFVESVPYELQGSMAFAAKVTRGAWSVGLDASSAFDHVAAAPEFRELLGVTWVGRDGRQRWYRWRSLPMGLSCTPAYWEMLFRPIMRLWAVMPATLPRGVRADPRESIYVHVFVDDVRVLASERVAAAIGKRMLLDMEKYGMMTNVEKSEFVPVQNFVHIGYRWRVPAWLVEIAPKRLTKLRAALERGAGERELSRRQAASLFGKIVSAEQVLGSTVYLHSRAIVAHAAARGGWDVRRPTGARFRRDVDHWRTALGSVGPGPSAPMSRPTTTSRVPNPAWWAVDASDAGMGALTMSSGMEPLAVAAAALPTRDRDTSSTYRELMGVRWCIDVFGRDYAGKRVALLTDNQAVPRMCRRGSSVPACNDLAVEIAALAATHKMQLACVWIPREANEWADDLSRWSHRHDHNDYHVTDGWWLEMVGRAGVAPEWDAFASAVNTRCQRWCTLFRDGGGGAVDAFSQTWEGKSVCAFPPPNMVKPFTRVLRTAGPVMMVIPVWKRHQSYLTFFRKGKPRSGVRVLSYSRTGVARGPVGKAEMLDYTMFVAILLQPGHFQ